MNARPHVRALLIAAVGAMPACKDPVPPNLQVYGYALGAVARGTDPATGDSLVCNLASVGMLANGALIDRLEGTARFMVARSRKTASLRITEDTLLAPQPVIMERLGPTRVRTILGGVFADTLIGDDDTVYYQGMSGNWTCQPSLPLAALHDGHAVSGTWHIEPLRPIE